MLVQVVLETSSLKPLRNSKMSLFCGMWTNGKGPEATAVGRMKEQCCAGARGVEGNWGEVL